MDNIINPHNLKKAYISIAMTGLPDDNIVIGNKAYAILKDFGYWVYLPHKLSEYVDSVIDNPKYKHYMGYDIWILSKCDVMFLIPGFEKSKGCTEEIAFAQKHHIPIFILDGITISNFNNTNDMIILEGTNLSLTIEAYEYYLTLINSNILSNSDIESISLMSYIKKRDKTIELLCACKEKAAQELIDNNNRS